MKLAVVGDEASIHDWSLRLDPTEREVPDERLEAALEAAKWLVSDPRACDGVARIAAAGGRTFDEVCGRGKDRELAQLRRIVACYLRACGYSYPGIGRLLGNRDHTTIMALVNGKKRSGAEGPA